MRCPLLLAAIAFSAACSCLISSSIADDKLRLLFLGDQGHHQPAERAAQLLPVLGEKGIEIDYSEDAAKLNLAVLSEYSGLILYANIDEIQPEQEAALLEYVAQGGGFIPLHCATYCFRNAPAIVELMGAQFARHGGAVMRTEIVQPEHPLMRGFSGFESWDETYIHTRHNDRNRIVLEVRRQGEQAEGREAEPWTWVRTHGKGRVFYTAWGHDERTWGNPGFINLVERGILWACGRDPSTAGVIEEEDSFPIPTMTQPRTDVAAFEYREVGPKIPNYLAGESWGTQGKIKTTMQEPLPPAESLKHFVTPEDFHLELFAAEPELGGKPIAFNWDHRGRLWVCETVDYPNQLQPPEQGRDRIRICEDTDNDGRADKFTVFAEQLSIPTSLEFYRDGVIVQAGVQTLFLRDSNGDDRADERTVLISGWQMGDTHGGVSNFQYGLDNHYWAMQGYNNSRPKFATGEHPGFRQGPFRFSVGGEGQGSQVTNLEFIRSTTNNSWGLGISEEGLVFASTANRAPSFFVPIPNRYYERVKGWTPSLMAEAIAPDHYFTPITDRVRQVDHHAGYTAGAGHALYTARNYPKSWWNRTAFVCGPTGHLIGTFVLSKKGSSFSDVNAFNLVASDDEWSAPIMAEVGPDGNVWILDWYNYIVQHNPTPQGFETGKGNAYESDLRDKTHGRIYRLVYDGDQGAANADRPAVLRTQDPASLVAGLQHSNRLWRRHAQRLLVERGRTDVVESLCQLIREPGVDATGNNAGATHALWTLHGLGALDRSQGPAWNAAVQALQHPAAGVRRNALLVLPPGEASMAELTRVGLTKDPEPQVQLAAYLAFADMPASALAGGYLARDYLEPASSLQDPHIRDALICAAASHSASFLEQVLSSTDEELVDPEVLKIVAEHAARSAEELPANLLVLLQGATEDGQRAVISGWAAGWTRPLDQPLPAQTEAVLAGLLEETPADVQGPLLRLGRLWGSRNLNSFAAKLSETLFNQIRDSKLPAAERIAAASEIVKLAGPTPEPIGELLDEVTPQMPPLVTSGIIRALATSPAANVGPGLVRLWESVTPRAREDVLAVLLVRPETTSQLLAAMEAGTIATEELTLSQRQALADHPDRDIRRRSNRLLRAQGGTMSANRQQVVDSYVAATTETGQTLAGKQVFTKNCANCHKHSGEGKEIGPDLTGMAVHPKEELLIHILDPSRSVEGNFRRYTLLTADGQVLTGMLAAESLSAVELIDSEGKTQSIAREDIERITSSNKSMMPEGFEQQLSQTDMRDLLEFLTQKGRFVPLPLAEVATAVSTSGLFHEGDTGPDRMIFSDWNVKEFRDVPFQVVDPYGQKRPNILLFHGPRGSLPPQMPKRLSLPCNMVIKQLHLLSGVSGWGFPASPRGSVSLIVRFHYEDGQTEDHPLQNGVHFADYIRRVDVPASEFAFSLGQQQIRYLSVQPQRRQPILSVELIKGDDETAPMIMAMTAEGYE